MFLDAMRQRYFETAYQNIKSVFKEPWRTVKKLITMNVTNTSVKQENEKNIFDILESL